MFECMATQRPIIFVGPIGAGSAITAESGGGIVVDGDGPSQLVQALADLASNPTRHGKLAASAFAASPRYSRERQAAETLALLTDLAGARP
jgi:glycosyltransferase involved in cell wall biosynthesis